MNECYWDSNSNSLQQRASARIITFRISLRWPIHIINSGDKTKLLGFHVISFPEICRLLFHAMKLMCTMLITNEDCRYRQIDRYYSNCKTTFLKSKGVWHLVHKSVIGKLYLSFVILTLQGSKLRLTGCQCDQNLSTGNLEVVTSWWLVICPITKDNHNTTFDLNL